MNDPISRMTGRSVQAFAASNFGIEPLLCRSAELSGGFDDLLSLDAIDELLSRRGLRTPFLRMSRSGELLPASRFTRGGGAGAEIADQVADDKVLAEFAAGATLVLQGLHRMWPPLQSFGNELVAQLGHPVQINAYLTPPQNTGFSAHYDVHDVFVLQFAGRKRWRIHEPVLEAPLRDQPWDARKAEVAARIAQPPLLETVLECGDVLYLPRGYIHAATSLGEISGHLTVGVHCVTRKTVVDAVFATLGGDLDLRRSLPAGVDLGSGAALNGEVDATLAALHAAIDRIDRSAIANALGRHLASATRPAPLRPIEQFSAAAALGPDDRVRLRTGLRVDVTADGSEHVVVALPDRTVRLSTALEDAVRAATSGDAVSARDLPGGDLEGQIAMLAQLLRAGVVVPA